MLKERSDMQEKMMHYIKMFVKEKNYPPSIREVGDALEIKSTSTVKGQLAILLGKRDSQDRRE